MTGLLGGAYIRNLFGSVLEDLYESGRLIKVGTVRRSDGTLEQVPLPVVRIRVQQDRMDETMRTQQGYTQRAQLDFTDQDVKLLVLQAGVPYDGITTDDIVECGDRRWRMYTTGEDPARSYWRGRGVRMTNSMPLWGWVFEFGHWDDTAAWRRDVLQPVPGAPEPLTRLEAWTPQATAAGVLRSVAGTPAGSWAALTDAVNDALSGVGIAPVADGESAESVRKKINQYVELMS